MKHCVKFSLLLLVCLYAGSFTSWAVGQTLRQPVVAGQFYPASAEVLRRDVERYLTEAEAIHLPGSLRMLVAPHAGYIYSGPIAGHAYKQIDRQVKRVFILASNHHPQANFSGLSVGAYSQYVTPLGRVKVSPIVQDLLQEDGLSFVPAAHATHVIEVQLPFLQIVLEDFELVPIITGRLNLSDITRFGKLLNRYADDDTLFIISSDLSHYHSYDDARQLDTSCVQALEHLDTDGVLQSELCGQGAALILLEVAKTRGWQGKVLDYRNSGDTAGDKARVVGYGAIAYYSDETAAGQETPSAAALSEKEQHLLLDLAQQTLERYLHDHETFEPPVEQFSNYPQLLEKRGAFVTLTKDGELRGCIGTIIGRQPVYLHVRDNAIHAAVHDSRFPPVTAEELPEIHIGISVLDVPKRLEVSSPLDYPRMLTPQDGVIIVSGNHTSTYLPQVWEQLPAPVNFLNRLCMKGGASANCWQLPGTQLYTYRAQEFGQH